MPKLPIVNTRKFIRILLQLGLIETRQKGSHKFFYRRRDNKGTVIPMHSKDLGRGLIRKILNEIDLSPSEYIKLLHKK